MSSAKPATRSVVLLLSVLVAVSLLGIGGWKLWWQPRSEYTCDGRPWGPSDPKQAAAQFTQSLVELDAAGVCRAATDNYTLDSLKYQVPKWHEQLGSPASVDEVKVIFGEQLGAVTPLTLQTESGKIELDIVQHGYQNRIS